MTADEFEIRLRKAYAALFAEADDGKVSYVVLARALTSEGGYYLCSASNLQIQSDTLSEYVHWFADNLKGTLVSEVRLP